MKTRIATRKPHLPEFINVIVNTLLGLTFLLGLVGLVYVAGITLEGIK